MPIICTPYVLQSGNHGRENNGIQPSPGITPNIGAGKPQLAQTGFVAPQSISAKQTVSIKNVITDPPTPTTSVNQEDGKIDSNKEDKQPTTTQNSSIESSIPSNIEDKIIDTEIVNTSITENKDTPTSLPTEKKIDTLDFEKKTHSDLTTENNEGFENDTNLAEHWNIMLDLIFAKVPTILFPLKDKTPILKDNILITKVKNNIQSEHFESKKRDVLAYFRNNFDPKIDDITVVIDTQMESKKIIYDTKDKIEFLQNKNPQISNFIDILNLTVKE